MVITAATDGSGSDYKNKITKGGFAAIVQSNPEIVIQGALGDKEIRDIIYNKEDNTLYFDFTNAKMNPTNNRGEFIGILAAIMCVVNNFPDEKNIRIITDSDLAIKTLRDGGYYDNWIKKNGFSGKKNLDIIHIIYRIKTDNRLNIEFVHQRAHLSEVQFLDYQNQKLNEMENDLRYKNGGNLSSEIHQKLANYKQQLRDEYNLNDRVDNLATNAYKLPVKLLENLTII